MTVDDFKGVMLVTSRGHWPPAQRLAPFLPASGKSHVALPLSYTRILKGSRTPASETGLL